ncbi:Rtr1/RPAP2 family-domain-containing protein [Diaporthe sp. PMI_573]|nr:Rtr1/RPAP2 family-domain-containing protein [Diaporthaceae sp. PMI_573]
MASETKPPIKGILKKPKTSPSPAQPSNPAPAPATSSKARAKTPQPPRQDPRQIAIQHARILQDRKDTETQILENVITLLDFPRSPSAPPASSPDPSDARAFVGLVRIFQPSDYDDLITERNLDGDKCGYVLCGNTRRRYKGAGTYKMVNKGRRDFDIVETAELERWCGEGCARRALWVKVQLNETAAWERVGLPDIGIELYPEKEEEEEGRADERLAVEMSRLQLREDHRKAAQDAKDLALERGDDAKSAPRGKVDVVVREKTVATQAEAPVLGDGAEGDSIEGYKTKFGTEPEKAS